MSVSYHPDEIKDRFLAKVRIEGQCWIWTGTRHSSGYGEITFRRKRMRAHRMSYLIFKGEIPHGLFVLHRCDVRACVNPDHLWIGTKADNARDATEKGRMHNLLLAGEQNQNRKLLESDFPTMRAMRARGITYKKIAEHLGVGETTVFSALKGISWRALHERSRQSISAGRS